jgi:hypothetical protein
MSQHIAEPYPEGANIGLTLENPLIVIAVTTRSERRASVERYIQKGPGLSGISQHETERGVNLVLCCNDLPGWTYQAPLISPLTRNIYAAMFHAASPPHPVIYCPLVWQRAALSIAGPFFGEIPTLPWQTLQSWFHFRAFPFGNN